ncbi:MAG: hypothetical protein R3F61_09555 [Myxococcota bacterium]
MVVLLAVAFADGGAKTCVMRGLPLKIDWTEQGAVKVRDGSDVLVSVDVGALVGTTTLKCLPEGLQFLTDTHRIPGKITLEKVNVGLGPTLDSLDPARFAAAAAARPAPAPAPRPAKKPSPAPVPEPVVAAKPRHRGADDAEACVSTRVWDAYKPSTDDAEAGWRVRALTTSVLEAGKPSNHAVALVEGLEYRFVACAQASVEDLDLVLVDTTGHVVAVDTTHGRLLTVGFRPPASGAYHVLLTDPAGAGDVGVALGVVVR